MLPISATLRWFACSALLCASAALLRAEVVFNNALSTRSEFHQFSTAWEYGDEIFLKSSLGSFEEFLVTTFSFEYYGDPTAAAGTVARIRFYANDGSPQAPGSAAHVPSTLLYDSGELPVGLGYQVRTLSGLGVTVPKSFTWTVQFSGQNDSIGSTGLLFAGVPQTGDPQNVGSSYKDFWIKQNGNWRTTTSKPPGGTPDFSAVVVAATETQDSEPRLRIKREGSTIVVEWSYSAVLQVATQPNGPYQTVAGAVSPYQVNASGAPHLFWRLVASQ
jgi:hypothetical protein